MRYVVTMTNRGLISLPARLRSALGLKGDDQFFAEIKPEGILLSPCVTLPIEIYSQERIDQFDAGEAELGETLRKKGLS
jgi:bifunctional DNA-binding transcriptional regulator/antitoxin component of YhaV-PrlF toxin-antitoxin module